MNARPTNDKGANGALVGCLTKCLSDCRRVGHWVSVHGDRWASGRADHWDVVPAPDDHWQGGCHAGVHHTD